ncbi:D-alanyl-D-alanine carboxypeptidase/D-alanyl-D-alanine-endopeptidase [Streptomyces diacarni]|uniref:D-alanyl-D-alanine carboxypeptidase/D-alanyl-D-alanine-endopeptidase n=1 Tax=Streptomyces diacarni TaxID=2800381 RepID=A0A367F273_9ACTN|nr:D-alanyl-D-alanine carboxypeptidase/D-alanyl-D-alanine-endopeptidase [Streptomyces diacarni]RCG23757.1 D-alanyl-D-alanine carboxypeptidase/D-alanyl-D-alanine-endopeptidase [Streptomyces diacarni]
MHDAVAKVRDTANRAYRSASRVARQVRGRARAGARAARRRWRAAAPQQRQTVRLATASAALGLVVALVAVSAAGPWDSGQRTAERVWAARQGAGSGGDHTPGGGTAVLTAPQVLAAAGPTVRRDGGEGGPQNGSAGTRPEQVPPPTVSALADTLEPLIEDGALGSVRHASVVDAVTGRQLFSKGAREVSAPASTIKLATAVAALKARGDTYRLATRAVGSGDRVTLVGGGDPTLTEGQVKRLAEKAARALEKKGVEEVRIGYDTSLYEGPEQHPIGPNENIARVTALMVEEGRSDGSDHGPAPRAAHPAGAAAALFADRLREAGVTVEGEPEERTAAEDARTLAVHTSQPLSALVERMLTNSDNDIAEALARQTALAEGADASFAGAGRAVEGILERFGLPVEGARFEDGSGLDRGDRISPALLTRLLTLAADPHRPDLRTVLTGLPVAGFTGTLDDRYGGERGAPGAGLVRAKTGTLTGVNTLAGTVVDADGRMLAFAFMTSGAPGADAAQKSLDRIASTLANCGCRDSPSAS